MAGQHDAREMLALYEQITVVANESLDVEEALRRGLGHVCRSAGWPVGHAFIVEGRQLVPSSAWHLSDPDEFVTFRDVTGSITLDLAEGEGPLRRVVRTGRPNWVPDVTADPTFRRARMAPSVGVRGAFAFPVLIGHEVVAVLEFYSREAVEADAEVLDVMRHVGVQLGRVFERSRARAAEREALEAERRYLRIAAHEMATPLAVVSATIDVLDDLLTEQPELADVIHGARRAVRRMRLISRNFLVEARLQGGSIRAKTESCDVSKVLTDALGDVPSLRDVAEVRADGDPTVAADPFLLRQCVVNLLTNAERYGEPPVVVDATATDGHVEIGVRDHGSGVPPEFIPKLFERFAKAGDGEGSGVGLEIVAGLVALQGGTVRYEPCDPGGRFVIELPRPAGATTPSDVQRLADGGA